MEHPKNDSFVVLSGYFDRTKSLAETGKKAAFRVRQRYTVGLVPCIAVFISSERLPKAWKNHEMKDKTSYRSMPEHKEKTVPADTAGGHSCF